MGGKSGSQVIGYDYEMGLHMGVCRGPVDALMQIEVGGRNAWRAPGDSSAEITGNQFFMILARELFGGTKGEGGIYGRAFTLFGADDQVVPDELKQMLGNPELQPEFRGVFTLYFDGLICSINPYPKPWKFKTRRIFNGWDGETWYPSKAQIELEVDNPDNPFFPYVIKAMNPAHMIYECLTNRDWGRGLPRTLLDDDAFRYAADLLYDEGFGLCMRWSRTDLLTTFIQSVLDHIGANLRLDKSTGLYMLKLLRKDYVAADLPIYTTDNGILEIRESSNGSMSSAINEVVLEWHNPIDNKPGEVRVQNVAAIQTAGATASSKVSYIGCPTRDLAAKLAQRDLKLNSTNLRRLTLVVDRGLWRLQPGEVFRISDPVRGIGQLILRVATAEEAGNTDGRITITCVQDVFALGLSTMVSRPPPPPPPEPVGQPPPAGPTLMYEKPYVELNREYPPGEFNALLPETGVFSYQMERADGSAQSYELYVNPDETDFVRDGAGEFTATCILDEAMTPILEVVRFRDPIDLDQAIVGGAAIINQEWVRVISIDTEENILTVKRGVADTRPWAHAAGDKVWFVTDNGGSNYRAYAATEVIQVKGSPFNGSGSLPLDQSPEESLLMRWRFYRPYLPGKVTTVVTGGIEKVWYEMSYMQGEGTSLFVNWAHRDRLLQADQLIDQQAGSIGPEPGVTCRVQVFDSSNIEVNQFSGITETSFEYTYEDAEVDVGPGNEGYLVLAAIRDGLVSWQSYIIPFQLPPPLLSIYGAPGSNLSDLPSVYNQINGFHGTETPPYAPCVDMPESNPVYCRVDIGRESSPTVNVSKFVALPAMERLASVVETEDGLTIVPAPDAEPLGNRFSYVEATVPEGAMDFVLLRSIRTSTPDTVFICPTGLYAVEDYSFVPLELAEFIVSVRFHEGPSHKLDSESWYTEVNDLMYNADKEPVGSAGMCQFDTDSGWPTILAAVSATKDSLLPVLTVNDPDIQSAVAFANNAPVKVLDYTATTNVSVTEFDGGSIFELESNMTLARTGPDVIARYDLVRGAFPVTFGKRNSLNQFGLRVPTSDGGTNYPVVTALPEQFPLELVIEDKDFDGSSYTLTLFSGAGVEMQTISCALNMGTGTLPGYTSRLRFMDSDDPSGLSVSLPSVGAAEAFTIILARVDASDWDSL